MGLSIFQIGLTLSFLLTLIVVLRLYQGVRTLNARVTILSHLVRELRRELRERDSAEGTPSDEEIFDLGDEGALSIEDLEIREQELGARLGRDFALAATRDFGPAKPNQAPPRGRRAPHRAERAGASTALSLSNRAARGTRQRDTQQADEGGPQDSPLARSKR